MDTDSLFEQIKRKQSFLCVGLDPDEDKIPSHLFKYDDPIFEFNKAIVDATHDLVVAYKPNLAFYEAMGVKGSISLEKTAIYIKEHYPEILLIADAKRGDIGNTAKMYARSLYEVMKFDAVTLSPYMGYDSIAPFLEYQGKWAIVLGVTSNSGAEDFQMVEDQSGSPLFMEVFRKAATWGNADQIMFVAGATRPEMLSEIRKIVPNHFLLVPGVGAQGGDLNSVVEKGMNDKCGLLINSSRGVIFAGGDDYFAQSARIAAHDLQEAMSSSLQKYQM